MYYLIVAMLRCAVRVAFTKCKPSIYTFFFHDSAVIKIKGSLAELMVVDNGYDDISQLKLS